MAFESPHLVLDNFVEGMTNFVPSDASEFREGSAAGLNFTKLARLGGFDFSKLRNGMRVDLLYMGIALTIILCISDPPLLRQAAGFVFNYVFNGKSRVADGLDHEKWVEYGFARFSNSKNIIVDEPLVLLAVLHHFTTERLWKLRSFLLEAFSNSDESGKGLSLERLRAYLLVLALRSPICLSTVFDFIGNAALKDETARLVATHRAADDQWVSSPVDISSNATPTNIFSHTPRNDEQILSWLNNPARTVFCFPVEAIGADLTFLLELSDGHHVRVVIRFKQGSDQT